MKLEDAKIQALKSGKISFKNLEKAYFVNVRAYSANAENVLKLLKYKICDFKQLVDKFKEIHELGKFLSNKELFENFIKTKKLNFETALYLFNQIDEWHESYALSQNSKLVQYIIKNNIVSFQEIVDKYKCIKDYIYVAKNASCLHELLESDELFEKLMKNNLVSFKELKHLLNAITKFYEINHLCKNTPLIKHILKECVLNKKILSKLNTKIQTNSWCKDKDIHTVFDLIEFYALYDYYGDRDECVKKAERDIDKQLLEANHFNKLVHSFNFDEDQNLELIGHLKDSRLTRDKLKYILDNQLESNYDFESLMKYLKKKAEKKNILNI